MAFFGVTARNEEQRIALHYLNDDKRSEERRVGKERIKKKEQAEDGIRDRNVTGVQTCALPILFSVDLNQVLAINTIIEEEKDSFFEIFYEDNDDYGGDY